MTSKHLMVELNHEEILAKVTTLGIVSSKTRSTTTVEQVHEYAKACSPEFVAQCALFAKNIVRQKDMSIVLLAHLLTRKETQLFNEFAPHILDNLGYIKKFVTIIRSKELGIQSLGTTAKNYIKSYLADKTPIGLYLEDYGTPTLKDIICLTHAKPTTEQEVLFSYLLGNKEFPIFLEEYKEFLAGKLTDRLPRFITPEKMLNFWNKLTNIQQVELINKMSWNQIRKNYQRISINHQDLVTSKLCHPGLDVFLKDLQSLVTTHQNLPEHAAHIFETTLVEEITNASKLDDNLKIQIFIDISGSMRKWTPHAAWLCRYLATTNSTIQFFNDRLDGTLEYDELMSGDARTLIPCRGGTTISSAIAGIHSDTDLAIIISDNETWGETRSSTPQKVFLEKVKKEDLKTKLVMWDLELKTLVPVVDKQVLNISGISMQNLIVINNFVTKDLTLVDTIKQMKIH